MRISHDSFFLAALRYHRLFVRDDSRQKLTPPDFPHPEAQYFYAIDLSVISVVGRLRAEAGRIRYVAL